MNTYEIVNPSDKYTCQAERDDVAAAACLIVGNGQYGLDVVGEDRELPSTMIFLAGSDFDLNEYFRTNFGTTFDQIMDERRAEIAECCDSYMIGDPADRASFEKRPSPD